jgi:hypothetical protein
MIPCPSFFCPMLGPCRSSRLGVKDMRKRMSFSWQCHVVDLHMLATKVSIILFRVTNVYSSSDASPCLFHVLSWTCELEIAQLYSA